MTACLPSAISSERGWSSCGVKERKEESRRAIFLRHQLLTSALSSYGIYELQLLSTDSQGKRSDSSQPTSPRQDVNQFHLSTSLALPERHYLYSSDSPKSNKMKTVARVASVLPFLAVLARAHGDHAEIDENSDYTYAELHMAQEVSLNQISTRSPDRLTRLLTLNSTTWIHSTFKPSFTCMI